MNATQLADEWMSENLNNDNYSWIAGARTVIVNLLTNVKELQKSENTKIIAADSMGFQIERLQLLLMEVRKDLANYHLCDDDRISIAMGKIDKWRDQ